MLMKTNSEKLRHRSFSLGIVLLLALSFSGCEQREKYKTLKEQHETLKEEHRKVREMLEEETSGDTARNQQAETLRSLIVNEPDSGFENP